jgi:hypothetical protein
VFVSSETSNGDLGGIAGADAKCQQLAEQAGLTGTFKAWLSTNPDDDPESRFTGATGYALVDGTMIATSWEDLTDGDILAPIDVTETGVRGISNYVWTNVSATGESTDSDDCNAWTDGTWDNYGEFGYSARSDSIWTERFVLPVKCGRWHHLYCFQD